METTEFEFIPQHDFFAELNFDLLDDQRFHGHIITCVTRLRKAQSCVVGVVYEAVQRGLPEADGCLTGREYFNKLGVSQSLYEAGMAIGKGIKDLDTIKHYFLNGQIQWTKLREVYRFISEDKQEWWLEQMSELSRAELKELLYVLGYKPRPLPKKDHELTSLKVKNSIRKMFVREFERACRADASIRTHTAFLAKLLACWRQIPKEQEKPLSPVTKESEDLKLEMLMSKAFEASMSQVERALERAKGDWSKLDIPRTIPKAVKEYVSAATSHLCAVPGCTCKIDKFHHLNRYSAYALHSPNWIRGLCNKHAALLDSGKVKQKDLGLPSPFDPKAAAIIDDLCRKKRLEAKKRKSLFTDGQTIQRRDGGKTVPGYGT